MNAVVKRLWTGFLIGVSLFALLLTAHESAQPVASSRAEQLQLPNGPERVVISRKQRSIGENGAPQERISLFEDLQQLLELKQEIEQIKAEAKDPSLDSRAKLVKLQELQLALERVKALKEIVENGSNDERYLIGAPIEEEDQNRGESLTFCNLELIETVPDVLIEKGYSKYLTKKSIFEAWIELIDGASLEINLMSQWAIDGVGRSATLFDHMKKAVDRSVSLGLLFNSHSATSKETGFSPYSLMKHERFKNQVHVGTPNISGLIHADRIGNIVHSKLIIADNQSFYIGSGNLGSRSTTRTKETGILATKCPALATDARKIWDIYNYVATNGAVPNEMPSAMETEFNINSPAKIFNKLDGTSYKVFIGASPPGLNPTSRSDDLSAILRTIDQAEKFIHISVGEYIPMSIYGEEEHHWSVIDEHLRDAAIYRGVELKMIVNEHASHKYLMKKYLKKFSDQVRSSHRHADVSFKFFSSRIDKHRFHGSHQKFMVTEKALYIGTSNWTEDYFTDTAGVCVVLEPDLTMKAVAGGGSSKKNLLQQMEDIFQRDWRSDLAKPV